VTEKGMSLKRR